MAKELVDFARDLLREHSSVKAVILCLVVKRRRQGRRHVIHSDFESLRQQFNLDIRRYASVDGRIKPYKHDRTILVNLSSQLSTDDIHVTSDRGLQLYNFSLRKAIMLGLGIARRQM